MFGLLEKDIRLTLTRKQTLLIFVVMAVIMGMSMDGAFLIGYLTMLAMITAVGTLSYDEFDNGLGFLMTLPYERKTYVKEKYIFCLLMSAAAWCIGAVMYILLSSVRHIDANPVAELPMLLSLIPAMYIAVAIMIPLQLKYGSEKSRIVMFVIFGCIAAVVFSVQTFSGNAANPLSALTMTLDSMSPAIVLGGLVIVCGLIAFISYLWSVRILNNREF